MSNESVLRGYAVGAGEGVPDRDSEVKASGRSTGGSLTVIEFTVDEGPPKHTHTREDESIYVFTGMGRDAFLPKTNGDRPQFHFYMNRRAMVWNNTGDRAYLRNQDGTFVTQPFPVP